MPVIHCLIPLDIKNHASCLTKHWDRRRYEPSRPRPTGVLLWRASIGASVFAGLSTLATPPSSNSDSTADPVDDVTVPQTASTGVPLSNATAQRRGGSSAATSAGERGDAVTGSCDCLQRGLLVVADHGGRLHLLCPACGAAAWSGSALASLGGASGQLRGGAASERAGVAGAGGHAMSSSPCWVRAVRPEWGTASGAGVSRTLESQLGTQLVWCTNGGIVGMSTVRRHLRSPAGPEDAHETQPSLPSQAATGIAAAHSPPEDTFQACVVRAGVRITAGHSHAAQQGAAPIACSLGERTSAEHVDVRCSGAVRLSSETFAAPMAFERLVVLGCRDDHLYCLRWS